MAGDALAPESDRLLVRFPPLSRTRRPQRNTKHHKTNPRTRIMATNNAASPPKPASSSAPARKFRGIASPTYMLRTAARTVGAGAPLLLFNKGRQPFSGG